MDGHTAIENRKVNEGGSGVFRFALSYLKDRSEEGSFIIHGTSNTSYSAGLNPLEFLQSSGLSRFQGHCQFLADRCLWREIGRVPTGIEHFEHMDKVQALHAAFKAFTDKADDLYKLCKQQDDILRNIGERCRGLQIFNAPVAIEFQPGEVPLWVQAAKHPQLLDLEAQRAMLDTQINDLSAYLPLLYATGDALEDAVLKAMRFLGLNAEKTAPGFTADILANTPDESRHFGLEVTGINGPVKKDSNKVAQLIQFEMQKEHNEKTILVANTHNTKPIAEREGQEHFTEPVLTVLTPHNILFMTGWDLYRLVGDVISGRKTKEAIVTMLHENQGVLTYA